MREFTPAGALRVVECPTTGILEESSQIFLMSRALCARRELGRFLLTVGLASGSASHICASPLPRVRSVRELSQLQSWHNGWGELNSL